MNHQQRLEQLLAMSNEDLDFHAAKSQSWKHTIGNPFWETPSGDFVRMCEYHPSTDLNQAWELASVEGSHFTIGDGHVIEAELEGDGDRLCFYRPFKNGEHTPARILTAFGILARELTAQ